MQTTPAPWTEKFALTTCPAADLATAIPAGALGVAVVFAPAPVGESSPYRQRGPALRVAVVFAPAPVGEAVYLVVESRARDLVGQCQRRLLTAGLPPVSALTVAFQAEVLPDASAEAIHAACRRQVTLAGELRRALRPAMR